MCQDQKNNKIVAWLPLGIMLPVIAMNLPRFIHPSGRFTEDWLDGLRGLVAGIGFGIMIMVIVKKSRQRRPGGA
jgi:uncharacterized membrane protein